MAAPAKRRLTATKRQAGGAYPGVIRIIGGQWRSRRLPVLTAEGLRPTPDRVRETLFNWLAPYIAGARCLDLFAGTGALCIEALSRGAADVVMVERDPTAAKQIRENIARLEARHAEVVTAEAFEYLARPPRPIDVVFLDPPFAIAAEMIQGCAERLSRGWVSNGALIYVEAPRKFQMPPLPAGWEPIKSGAAGQVAYFLLRVSS